MLPGEHVNMVRDIVKSMAARRDRQNRCLKLDKDAPVPMIFATGS